MNQQSGHLRTPSGLWLIPNALTLLRLAAAAAFPVASPWWRIGLLLGAALTDLLDGYLARRYRLTNWWGSLLDGIADKAITLSVLITMSFEGHLAIRQIALVLVRDFAVVAITGYMVWRRAWPEFTRLNARMPGKVTTIMLFILMLALLIAPEWAWIIYWPTVLFGILAAIDYVLIFLSVDLDRK